MNSKKLLKRLVERYLDFKRGHGQYTVYFYGITNLLLLVSIKFNISVVSLVPIVVMYFPVASLIGYLHRRFIMKVEYEITWKQNKMWMDVKEDIVEIKEKIDSIERKV